MLGKPQFALRDVGCLLTVWSPREGMQKSLGGVWLSKLVFLPPGPAGSSQTSRRARSRPSATRTE